MGRRATFIKPNRYYFEELKKAGQLRQAAAHAARSIEYYDERSRAWAQRHAETLVAAIPTGNSDDDDDNEAGE